MGGQCNQAILTSEASFVIRDTHIVPRKIGIHQKVCWGVTDYLQTPSVIVKTNTYLVVICQEEIEICFHYGFKYLYIWAIRSLMTAWREF